MKRPAETKRKKRKWKAGVQTAGTRQPSKQQQKDLTSGVYVDASRFIFLAVRSVCTEAAQEEAEIWLGHKSPM